ncbi:MAG: metal ABC transporter ATP-binding protein [Flavobacteriales bacterium]|nr:metal ABC transporter ATP-binding protein [Flavobacteriales bacterium]
MSRVIEINYVNVFYDDNQVLKNVNLSIQQGKLIGLVGPNGVGKSTLVKTIMGLIKPNSGNIGIWGQPVKNVLKKIAYVPQRESVDWDFPASVMDVTLMGTYSKKSMFRRTSSSDKQIALNALKEVEMEEFADRQISELSGGQQQRTFLARALAQQANLYLMDEPFAGVDSASEQKIIKTLKSRRDQGETLIVVHHALHAVREYFDEVILLNKSVIAHGSVEEVYNENNLRETYGQNLFVFD